MRSKTYTMKQENNSCIVVTVSSYSTLVIVIVSYLSLGFSYY